MRWLAGARVLDFTATAAGAWATRLLSEVGAQVIRPQQADGTEPGHAELPDPAGKLRWRLRHRGKWIVAGTLDDCASRYAQTSDLIIVDTATGNAAAAGTAAAVVRLRHGLGNAALLGDAAVPDYALSAVGGLTFITGDPAQSPVTPRDLVSSRLAALYTACIACAALIQPPARTVIDVMVLEAVASSLESTLPIWFVEHHAIGRAMNMHDIAWPVAAYQTRDGWVGISCGRIEDTRRLMSILGMERLVGASVSDFIGLGDVSELDQRLIEALRGRESAALVEACQAARIAAAVAVRPADLLRDEQAIARGFTSHWTDGTPVLCSPVTASGAARITPPPPRTLRRSAVSRSSTPAVGTSTSASDSTGDGLLSGIRVLDLTWALAGPFATMLLADLGADVVKVESSEHVDSSRLVVPYLGFADIERSGYFRFFNRNKRSIELDLGRQAGEVRQLAARAHAVVENLRPGSLDGKGLGYQQLRRGRADLAMCSISGFGRSGPRSSWASYGGAMAECASGLAMATGGTRPVSPARALADIFAGLYAALGVCAQLYQQAHHRRGGHIEVTQFEAGAGALEEMLVLPPEVAEHHQIIGSDALGWRAAGACGEWPVQDASTVATALDAAGAVQRFSTAEGTDAFVSLPALVSGERTAIRCRSPRLGEHTDVVLADWLSRSAN